MRMGISLRVWARGRRDRIEGRRNQALVRRMRDWIEALRNRTLAKRKGNRKKAREIEALRWGGVCESGAVDEAIPSKS